MEGFERQDTMPFFPTGEGMVRGGEKMVSFVVTEAPCEFFSIHYLSSPGSTETSGLSRLRFNSTVTD